MVKRLLKETNHANEGFWVGRQNYRTSPQIDRRTPSKLLIGTCLGGRLPDFGVPKAPLVCKHRQDSTSGHQLTPLEQGGKVRIPYDSKCTTKARVNGQVAPRYTRYAVKMVGASEGIGNIH